MAAVRPAKRDQPSAPKFIDFLFPFHSFRLISRARFVSPQKNRLRWSRLMG